MSDARLRAADFDFTLPDGAVAQRPAEPRDSARLLHVQRAAGVTAHHRFRDLPSLLRAGDLLVVNDTRVFPARIRAVKAGTGGQVELLMLRTLPDPDDDPADREMWEALARAARALRPGVQLDLPEGRRATVLAREGEVVRLSVAPAGLLGVLHDHGRMPLPPYIKRGADTDPALEDLDRERYQTVFARETGAVAAPTAGLHFTPALLQRVRDAGISVAPVTLHVGWGTFRPVRDEELARHELHAERYHVPAETARAVAAARRVVAVGTTVARALEASGGESASGETRLFIHPGYRWQVVGALVTNFHLPRSTLLMLVASLVPGWRPVYEEAVAGGYRFYSYGDAMFIE